MDIVCCRSTDEVAEKAFRLRYMVYGAELDINNPDIDHQRQIYEDASDKIARIYVAIKDANAIATCRTLYDRDCVVRDHLSEPIYEALEIEKFQKHFPGKLAISTKFAISPSQRGSLAAHLVTAKMFEDIVDDGIEFVFSWCAPYLFNFYSKLGFHMYSHAVSDENGLWTPIVFPTRDWTHLKAINSPFFKQLEKKQLCEFVHPSVDWFNEQFGASLDVFVSDYEDVVLDKIFSLGGSEAPSHSLQDVSIFSAMSPDEVKGMIDSNKLLNFEAGENILQAGQRQDEMFIVLEGLVDVSLDGTSTSSVRLGPGQIFGEIAMLTRAKRSANCVAATKTLLTFLSRQDVSRLVKGKPELAAKLLFNLSKSLSLRLLRTNEEVRSLQGARGGSISPS